MLNAAFPWDKSLRLEMSIEGSLAKLAFSTLLSSREEIEHAFSKPLEWEELPENQSCRVASYMPGNEKRENRERWPAQREWLLTWGPKLANANSAVCGRSGRDEAQGSGGGLKRRVPTSHAAALPRPGGERRDGGHHAALAAAAADRRVRTGLRPRRDLHAGDAGHRSGRCAALRPAVATQPLPQRHPRRAGSGLQ